MSNKRRPDTTLNEASLSERNFEEAYPEYQGQIKYAERINPRDGKSVNPDKVLQPELADRVGSDLWTHQAEALDLLAEQENVVVTTSTSSGKTWVYALQIARNYLRNPENTALCLFPMKALTRDQKNELQTKLQDDWNLDITIGVYDGDTSSDQKRRIRKQANVILTNPAGLNVYLPRHNKDRGWHRFYNNLELVVVDEAHEYSGVTGTHVAFIIRRLRRLLNYYDTDPQFVMTTATIGNPAEHGARLTGAEFSVVDEDGSPRGQRDIIFWEPPIDESQLSDNPDDPLGDYEQARVATGTEAASVTAHLGINGAQTLQFCTARQGTEVGAKQIVNAAQDHPESGFVETQAYHAGLGKQQRRQVETRLKNEQLDAVATTNALELGIDIGSVDATVTAGYPGTRQSFWQQVGRAGRGDNDAVSVLIGGMDAMDGYIFEHPSYLTEAESVEDAVVSISNEQIYSDHILAAASERPLQSEDAMFFGDESRFGETVAMWQKAGFLEEVGSLDGGGVTYTGDPRPQSRISLYGTDSTEYTVICKHGEIDHDPVSKERAYRDYHEGALFLHAGQQYKVAKVDHTSPRPQITVTKTDVHSYTQTQSNKSIQDITVINHRPLANGYDLYFGEGTVNIQYDRYHVRDIYTGDIIQHGLKTGSPPLELNTELMWVSLPEQHCSKTIAALDGNYLVPSTRAEEDRRVPDEPARYTYAGGLHAAEHGIIQLAPLELMIDNADVGGLSTPRHHHHTTPGPVWFIHDGIDGGVGFSKAIYENFTALAKRTLDRVENCQCSRRRGCPLCVMSEHCGNNNDPLDTLSGSMILNDVLCAINEK